MILKTTRGGAKASPRVLNLYGVEMRASIRLHSFSILIAVLLLTSHASAQNSGIDPDVGNPGLGGRNTIQGRIYYPTGNPLDRRIRVKVSSVRGGPGSVSTDDNGAFTIERLIDGTYNLSVDAGSAYEIANESVQIIGGGLNRSGQGQTVFVQITLQLKGSNSTRPGVINAAEAALPKAVLELYQQALQSAQSGEHKKAIEQLKKVVAQAPDFAPAHNELGVQYLQTNDLQHANESLAQAVKLAPDAFMPRLNHGLVLLQLKKFGDAISELNFAIHKNEGVAVTHEYLGRALIGEHQLDEAEKELQRAITLGGDQAANAHRYLGALYMQKGDDARAIEELEKYLKMQPKVKDADQIKAIIKELSAKH